MGVVIYHMMRYITTIKYLLFVPRFISGVWLLFITS